MEESHQINTVQPMQAWKRTLNDDDDDDDDIPRGTAIGLFLLCSGFISMFSADRVKEDYSQSTTNCERNVI